MAMDKDEAVEKKESECRCPRCGGSDLEHGVRTQKIEFAGLTSGEYNQPGIWCQTCGEGLITFEQMAVGGQVLADLKVRLEIEDGDER